MIIAIPPCPQEKEGERHPWIMIAANKCAHQAIKETVDFIASNLTRAPSPYNEVEETVRKAFREAAGCSGCNRKGKPQPAHHASDISGDADRAAKERAAKRARWSERLATPSEAQRETISELLVVAPEVIEALSGMEMLFCAESSEGPAIVVCDRERKTAASLRLNGEPWKSSGQLEKLLPGSERGWPPGLEEGASPIFLAAGAAGLVRIFHMLWCADMARDVTAVALLDATRPIAPAALRLFAGRKVCAFFDTESRTANALLAVGAYIFAFDFSSYRRDDEQPVRNLADFVRIHPDDWEIAHAALAAAAAPQNPSVP